jgi:hypothetical protein
MQYMYTKRRQNDLLRDCGPWPGEADLAELPAAAGLQWQPRAARPLHAGLHPTGAADRCPAPSPDRRPAA